MMSTTDNGRVFRSPFTANQWQEFEHQTLIYKYMISGVPVPPELIFPVKRSLEARLLPYQQPPIGWGCFQVGFGRKPDPEPGRCRRTDGKKWRCSKEAYPDSKYCEKHMHRGRSRSRKPVELAINNNSTTTPTPTTTTTANPTTHSSSHRNIASASNSTLEPTELLNNPNAFIYSQDPDKDYRYYHGMRESMNERDFFTDSSGSLRSMQESYQTMSNTNTSINSYRGYHHQLQPPQVNVNYSTLGTDYASKQQQHCYILGADFKSSPGGTKSMKLEKESDHSQRPLHHFFSEWAPKNTSTDCWLDLSSSSRSNTGT